MNPPKILFEACGESGRYDLSKPYRWGDAAYATDGRIMVRSAITDGIELPGERKVPDPNRIEDGQGCDRVVRDLPEAEATKFCNRCSGTGKSDSYECENCGETQRITINGVRVEIDCLSCDGNGTTPNLDPVMVSDLPRVYVQARYVALLRRHGVRLVNVPAIPQRGTKNTGGLREAITFSGDGFDGWLMPMVTELVEKDLHLATKEMLT